MTPVDNASVSRFVVPNKVDVPPVVYLYNSTSTANASLVLILRCVTNAHNPEGILVMFGTPESVANVAINCLVAEATATVTDCSAPLIALGDNSLYVGVPNAESVLFDKFIY